MLTPKYIFRDRPNTHATNKSLMLKCVLMFHTHKMFDVSLSSVRIKVTNRVLENPHAFCFLDILPLLKPDSWRLSDWLVKFKLSLRPSIISLKIFRRNRIGITPIYNYQVSFSGPDETLGENESMTSIKEHPSYWTSYLSQKRLTNLISKKYVTNTIHI